MKVVIAENESLIREALTALLDLEDDIEVVAAAPSGDQVLDLVERHAADLALLDMDMPGLNGIQVAELLCKARPGFPVIILTSHGRPGYLQRAIKSGVRGFLTKEVSIDRLVQVIREVQAGGRYVDPGIAADAIAAGDNPLSPRELEILKLAEDGRPLSEIAGKLHLSEGTVRNHMSSAIAKLGASNKTTAVRIAVQAGWL
ncbi:response regulator transcription factor [Nonomuraea sp. NPDC000554]|uniref:response regulator transcription factor n=1 Tax=Nonomuraea sp. NPDC000554 TaxID=3154259 RepID=UPI00333339E0